MNNNETPGIRWSSLRLLAFGVAMRWDVVFCATIALAIFRDRDVVRVHVPRVGAAVRLNGLTKYDNSEDMHEMNRWRSTVDWLRDKLEGAPF